MNCLEQVLQIQQIVQGQDLPLNVRLIEDGDPFDITGASEIVAVFTSTLAPLYIEKKMSQAEIIIASAPGGRMIVNLVPADTNLLPVGTGSFEIRVTIGGKVTIVQFLDLINVVPSLSPLAP